MFEGGQQFAPAILLPSIHDSAPSQTRKNLAS